MKVSILTKSIVTLLLLLTNIFSAASAVVPVQEFARLPFMSNPKLSPDGQRIAVKIVLDGRELLLAKPTFKRDENGKSGVISVGDFYIENYKWVNDERLIISVRDTVKYQGEQINITRMVAINWDGSNAMPIKMLPNEWGFYRQLPSILEPLLHDKEHVLALLDDEGWAQPHVHKVNVYTGKREKVQRNVYGVQDWVADQNGNVLVGERTGTKRSTDVKTYYRSNTQSDWQVMQKTDYFSHDRLIPYKAHPLKPGILLLSTRSEKDYWSLTDDTEVDLFEYDLSAGKVIGKYENKELAAVKRAIKRALNSGRIALKSKSADSAYYIFEHYTDTAPSTFYLFDTQAKRLSALGVMYPALKNKPMAEMQSYHYKARDGLEIPAFLTLPLDEDTSNLPLIVFPHGGPWAHDKWGFNPWVQYFASRGYAVFQPQFRGSTGHGIEHEEAGYGQWGAAIQDDITDGVLKLVDQGIVDKNRICIVGASFGGYASAMGLAKTPDLYRCGISINGVLDLVKFKQSARQLLYAEINRTMWNETSDLKPYSPIHNIEKIDSPLLLIAATGDTVVPYKHSKRMYKKMRKAKKEVEYLEIKGGEHWRTNETHEVQILETISKFLEQHLTVNS